MDPLDLPKAGIKRRRLYCEHCESYLLKSAYYRHRMRYLILFITSGSLLTIPSLEARKVLIQSFGEKRNKLLNRKRVYLTH